MVLIKVQLCLESLESFEDELGWTSANRLDEDGTSSHVDVPWPDDDANGFDG